MAEQGAKKWYYKLWCFGIENEIGSGQVCQEKIEPDQAVEQEHPAGLRPSDNQISHRDEHLVWSLPRSVRDGADVRATNAGNPLRWKTWECDNFTYIFGYRSGGNYLYCFADDSEHTPTVKLTSDGGEPTSSTADDDNRLFVHDFVHQSEAKVLKHKATGMYVALNRRPNGRHKLILIQSKEDAIYWNVH